MKFSDFNKCFCIAKMVSILESFLLGVDEFFLES